MVGVGGGREAVERSPGEGRAPSHLRFAWSDSHEKVTRDVFAKQNSGNKRRKTEK